MEYHPNDTTKATMIEAQEQDRSIIAGQVDIKPVDTSSADAMLASLEM